jgi:hypothetical protein
VFVGELNFAVELLPKGSHHTCAEAASAWLRDGRATPFGPSHSKALTLNCPGYLNTPARCRESAELRGVGTEFVQGHSQRDHSAGRDRHVGTFYRNRSPLPVVWLSRAANGF